MRPIDLTVLDGQSNNTTCGLESLDNSPNNRFFRLTRSDQLRHFPSSGLRANTTIPPKSRRFKPMSNMCDQKLKKSLTKYPRLPRKLGESERRCTIRCNPLVTLSERSWMQSFKNPWGPSRGAVLADNLGQLNLD